MISQLRAITAKVITERIIRRCPLRKKEHSRWQTQTGLCAFGSKCAPCAFHILLTWYVWQWWKYELFSFHLSDGGYLEESSILLSSSPMTTAAFCDPIRKTSIRSGAPFIKPCLPPALIPSLPLFLSRSRSFYGEKFFGVCLNEKVPLSCKSFLWRGEELKTSFAFGANRWRTNESGFAA